MKQSKDFQDIVGGVKGIFSHPHPLLVDTPEEKAAAYKILKNFAKLSPESRQALFPGLKEVSGTPFLRFVLP